MTADLELRRVVERWRSLPLDHALSRMPTVQAVVQALADAVAEVDGRWPAEVPALGPRVVMDQLTVMVFDAVQAGLDPAAELRELRRAL